MSVRVRVSACVSNRVSNRASVSVRDSPLVFVLVSSVSVSVSASVSVRAQC